MGRDNDVRELCGQAFATIGQLNKHTSQVHGDGSYPCPGCLISFTTKQGLKDHKNRNNCFDKQVGCCMHELLESEF